MAQTIRRRAKSAGETPRLMEANMDEAFKRGKGHVTQNKHTGSLTLYHSALGQKGTVELVNSNGDATRAGKYWYALFGVPPPTIYQYEQPLIDGKWVNTLHAGLKRGRTRVFDTITGKPTKQGDTYFKFNKDEYYAEYPARLARPVKNDKTKEWMFDTENNDAYMGKDHVIPRQGITDDGT